MHGSTFLSLHSILWLYVDGGLPCSPASAVIVSAYSEAPNREDFFLVFLANAATYALVGPAVETPRQRLNHAS
jgi:hypothetical protein